ncbi:hypothetical protein AALD22_23190 [Lachnospiraceae bacterium 56-18]|jgi:hypothetical protein
MNKWEKVFYKDQFYEVKMKLEENMRQQKDMYETIMNVLFRMEERLDETGRSLLSMKESMEKNQSLTESRIYEGYVQMQQALSDGQKENRENFKDMITLLKMVLANRVLDDWEKAIQFVDLAEKVKK